MKKKNRFLSFAIALIMILPAMFVLVSCGEKEKTYSVSAVLLNHDEDDYNISLSSAFDSTVDAGGSTTIEVNFVSGYDHVPLVAKLNEKEVQGVVIYTETGDELNAEDIDYSKPRTWKLKLENIREDKSVVIDVKDCGLVDVKLSINSTEATTARVALKNTEYSGFVLGLNEQTVLGYKNFENYETKIPFGKPFYVLLDGNFDTINIGGFIYYKSMLLGENYYKDGQSVFYVYDGITKPSTVGFDKDADSVEEPYYADEYGCFHLDVEPLENVSFLLSSWWTEKDYEGYLSTDTINGVQIKDITSTSGTSYLMYIGNHSIEDHLNKIPNSEYVSDKMYVKINVYDETMFGNGSFYLADDKNGKNKTKLPDECVKKSENGDTFIVLKRDDVFKYFKVVETSNSYYTTGHAFLFFELNSEYLTANMTGFKVNSSENLKEPFKINTTSVDEMNGFKYIQNGVYYFNNSDIFDAENNYKNNISVVAGVNYNDLLHNRYNKVSARVLDEKGNKIIFDGTLESKNFTLDSTGRVLIPIPAFSVDCKEIIVNLTYEVSARDVSEHVISFENLNLADGEELYISLDLVNWTKVSKDTANIVISYAKPLYYYTSIDGKKATLKDANNNTVNVEYFNDFVTDIDGVTITVGEDFEAKKVLPLKLIYGYLGNGATLYFEY